METVETTVIGNVTNVMANGRESINSTTNTIGGAMEPTITQSVMTNEEGSSNEEVTSKKKARLTDEQKHRILELKKSGMTSDEIATKVGCSVTCVNDTVRRDSVEAVSDAAKKKVNGFIADFQNLLTKKSELEGNLANADKTLQLEVERLEAEYKQKLESAIANAKENLISKTKADLETVNSAINGYKEMLSAVLSA